MRQQAKWFSSALTMAFLAVVALCVSPALAWSCCCAGHDSGVTSSIQAPSHAAHSDHFGHSCCDDDEAPAKGSSSGAASVSAPNADKAASAVSSVKIKCDCAHLEAQPIAAFDAVSQSAFAPLVLALPLQPFQFSLEEDARFTPCFDYAARPRSPSRRERSGRAPPVWSC